MARTAGDLHLHTMHSDGTFEPRELVRRAKAMGFGTIAITDHDSVEGVYPAMVAGEKLDLRVIPGVELSAHYLGTEVHIVGLFVDVLNPSFLETLQTLQQLRVKRIHTISKRLRGLGLDITAGEILAVAGEGTPSRAHVAKALVERGLVNDYRTAFSRYLGDTRPANAPKRFLTMRECLELIRSCSGVAVFAHPGVTRQDELLRVFADLGGNAIEAYYPSYTNYQTRHYLQLAEKLNLLPSGGSDCHGFNRPELLLGRIRLPEHVVDALERVARFGHVGGIMKPD